MPVGRIGAAVGHAAGANGGWGGTVSAIGGKLGIGSSRQGGCNEIPRGSLVRSGHLRLINSNRRRGPGDLASYLWSNYGGSGSSRSGRERGQREELSGNPEWGGVLRSRKLHGEVQAKEGSQSKGACQAISVKRSKAGPLLEKKSRRETQETSLAERQSWPKATTIREGSS